MRKPLDWTAGEVSLQNGFVEVTGRKLRIEQIERKNSEL